LVFLHVLRSNFTASFLKANISSLKEHSKQILSFLVSTNLTDLFKIVQKNGATLALGYFSSPVQAGFFKLAQSFANRLTLIYDPVFYSVYPEITDLWAKKRVQGIVSLLRKLVMTLTPLGLVAIFMTILFGKTVIGWTVGLSYLPAVNVLIVLVISQAIACTLIWLGPTLLAMGRPGWRTLAVASGTAAMILGLYVLVPDFGAVGAAFSIILSHVFWAAVGGVKLRNELRAHS
jgi:O-antigen/teichoic acid export membrane protein